MKKQKEQEKAEFNDYNDTFNQTPSKTAQNTPQGALNDDGE